MKNINSMERKERPVNPLERPMQEPGRDKGPGRPKTDSSKENLLKRMRKVDPKQSERYRQRTGE
ncbi:MAG: ubiquitin-like protein UBact [Nitrospiria bacterium]